MEMRSSMSVYLSILLLFLCNGIVIKSQELSSTVLAVDTTTPSSNTSGTTKDPRLTGDPRHDYIYDPNLPRELNGYDLATYPFYTAVPTDITFKCDGRHDGYYASIPHHCQLFHLCVHSHRHDFLCANYTVFDQTQFICQFVNSVNCSNSEFYYDRNNELYVTTTTTEPPEYEDEYEEEPRTKRPRRRKNKRRQKARRRTTTTLPPDEYYDDYEEEPAPPDYLEEEPAELPPTKTSTRRRTKTTTTTEEPTTRSSGPKVRKPQLRAPKPLETPAVEDPTEPEADTATTAEEPEVRNFRGSPIATEEHETQPSRQSRPPVSEVQVETDNRAPRRQRPQVASEETEPASRPLRERRPPKEIPQPASDNRDAQDPAEVPVRPLSRRYPASQEAASNRQISRQPAPPTDGTEELKRPSREPQRPSARAPAPPVRAPAPPVYSTPIADPSSVIAGILSGVGAVPPPPPPPPSTEQPLESEEPDHKAPPGRPENAPSQGTGGLDATAPGHNAQAASGTNGKRRVLQKRRKGKRRRTTTTTTTTTTVATPSEYEYEYIE